MRGARVAGTWPRACMPRCGSDDPLQEALCCRMSLQGLHSGRRRPKGTPSPRYRSVARRAQTLGQDARLQGSPPRRLRKVTTNLIGNWDVLTRLLDDGRLEINSRPAGTGCGFPARVAVFARPRRATLFGALIVRRSSDGRPRSTQPPPASVLVGADRRARSPVRRGRARRSRRADRFGDRFE